MADLNETLPQSNDLALVNRILDGNPEAVRELFIGKCGERLAYLVRRFDYEDLPQELFLSIREENWRRLRTWSGSGPVAAWLCRAAVNLCVEKTRKGKRFVFMEPQILENLRNADAGENAEDIEIGQAKRGDLMKAIESLRDERQMQIIRLTVLTDPPWEVKAVCDLLRITENHLYQLKRRALNELKKLLMERGWRNA